MKYFGLAILFLLVLFFPSCEKELVQEEKSGLLAWDYGKNEYNIEIDGVERNFLIHVPEKYTGETEVPMVMMLHGSSGTGTRFYNISRWVEKADEEGFIAVFPTALAYKLKENNRVTTKWSSEGLTEQVEDGTEIKDDIPFIKGLVDLIKESFKINGKRIYVSGFSNGGAFVKTEIVGGLAHLFAAASAACCVGNRTEIDADGERLMPFHNIVGANDLNNVSILDTGSTIFPLEGGKLKDHEEVWGNILNILSPLELGEDFTEQAVLPQYNEITFSSDNSGQGNEYVLVIVKDLEHSYPNEINNPLEVVAADILWDWFMEWEL